MKRTLIVCITLVMAAICIAAPPKLACEKIFDRKDIRTEGHDIVKITQPANYFRGVTADRDKSLLKDVQKAFDEDRKRACNVVEGFDGKNDYAILNITNNGCVINVGFYWNDNGYVNLFIQSDPKAFK